MLIRTIISAALCFGVGLCVGFGVALGSDHQEWALRVMVNEYVGLYCEPRPKEPLKEAAYIAQSAMLSRMTIEMGIGEYAYAAMMRCKFWNTVARP